MGGGGVARFVSNAVAVVASPVVATVKAAEAVAPKQAAAIEKSVPVAGTLAQGVKGAANIVGDIVSGDSSGLKADISAVRGAATAVSALESPIAVLQGNSTFDNSSFDFASLIPKQPVNNFQLPGAGVGSGGGAQRVPDYGAPQDSSGSTIALAAVALIVVILIIKKGK